MIAHGRWSGYPPRSMIVGVFIHRRLEIQCPIEFLIDTGADRTLIAPEYQAILRIPDNELTPYTTPVRTLGGNQYFSYLSDCILVFPSDTPKSLCYKNLNLFFYSPRRKLGFLHPLHKQNPIEWQGKFPSILGRDVLSEDFISTFFNVPAVVEVYLTTQLTKEEIGLFQFHLGELYRAGVATDVFFAGERIDEKGSVLRFQGNSFEEIYKVLPDLLAPFRMLKAIDFRMTVENIPPKDREEVIVELVRLETSTPSRRWQVAGRLAEIFESFRNAKVYRIAEKGSRGIRIDVFTDERVAKKLSHQGLAEVWDGNRPLSIVTNGSNTIIQMEGDKIMRDKYVAGQAGAQGPSSHVHDLTFIQTWNRSGASIDLSVLVGEIGKLREHLKKNAETAEHDVAIGALANAEISAKESNGPKTLEWLSKAGKWALDAATQIGVRVAAAAIRIALGLN